MRVNDDPVRVVDMTKALHIAVPHEFLDLCDELPSLILDRGDSLLGDRGVTNALEEFDAFLSF